MEGLTGQIFNIQHFSTEDGPGVRTTVFFQGCPLKCLWCANPESQQGHCQLAHRASLCIKCGYCIRNCPRGALSIAEGKIRIDRESCVGCGNCAKICPSHAMFFYGERKSVEEIFREVVKDQGYYKLSGGGITCSGGECMLQPQAVGTLFMKCKERGIHTTLDTCGEFPAEALHGVLEYTDLVLFDLKHMNPEKHREYTAFGNEQILQNLERIVRYGTQIWIRIPVVPGYNDSMENLTATADYIRKLDSGLHVDLLPYHRFGEGKYQMLDIPYKLRGIASPSDGQKEYYKKIFTDAGLDCTIH